MNPPVPTPAPLRVRQITPALEYCAWAVLLLTPCLRLAHGPPVTPDQGYFQLIVVAGSFLAAVILRLYNWRTSRRATTPESAPDPPEGLASRPSRRHLEAAIRDDPDEASNYLALARLLTAKNRFDEAQRTLEIAADYCSPQEAIRQEQEIVAQRRIERTKRLGRARAGQRRDALNAEPLVRRFPWLEVLLGIAAAALGFWIFPGAWGLLAAYFGGPVATTAFLANAALLALLLWIRLH